MERPLLQNEVCETYDTAHRKAQLNQILSFKAANSLGIPVQSSQLIKTMEAYITFVYDQQTKITENVAHNPETKIGMWKNHEFTLMKPLEMSSKRVKHNNRCLMHG